MNPLSIRWMCVGLLAVLGMIAWGPNLRADDPPANAISADDERFFEERVRPLLVEHCHGCHGAKKQEGALRLDSREALLKGGDGGPPVIPGKPDDSDLIDAITYDGSLKMPPAGKLPEPAIATLTEWIRRGAPWSQKATAPVAKSMAEVRASHWAFRPVVKPALLEVAAAGRLQVQNEVDRFVLAKLENAGLTHAPPADRRTLYRRASFDLLGLPPDPAKSVAFAADSRTTPDAFRAVVDEMLASPRYGERWGRYWLDLARYADNKGYVFFEEQTYPWGYAYRDWVIKSLNEDLPYDQFLVAQLAADQLPAVERDRHLAALGFITIGGHFVNNVHDIFDDRIDVVSRGLLGLTATCARCHDHKFDPIPQADYYALYGVFRSSQEPMVLPRLADFLRAKHAELVASGQNRLAEYVLLAHASRDQPSTEDFMLLIPEGDLHPTIVQRYWLHLQKTKRTNDRVWRVWHALAAIPESEFAARAPEILASLKVTPAGVPPTHPLVLQALAEPPPQTLKEAAERFGKLLLDVETRWRDLTKQASAGLAPLPTALPDPLEEELRLVFHGPDAPANMPLTTGWGVLTLLPDRAAQAQYQKLLKELENWMIRAPLAPPRAMALEDDPQPYEPRVFLRGNPNRAGDLVPRRFFEVLSEQPTPFQKGSGRLELAQAIASPTNPLTARVFVNRVWLNHFGAGLARTPSDFGVRSEPPSHPELLDWLAASFMEQGWSVKQLHRTIMNSATYQQSSTPAPPDGGANPMTVDSENRLLWRMNRRRLDFEGLRDSLLWASGTLDLTVGGPSVNLLAGSPRRTVYGFIDRLALPGLLRTFDFPSPDNSSPGRDNTTVAPQALYLMNGPFAQDCARKLAARPEIATRPELSNRVEALFRLLFARNATAEEQAFAREFFGDDPAIQASEEAWRTYAHALLLTNEFVFVD